MQVRTDLVAISEPVPEVHVSQKRTQATVEPVVVRKKKGLGQGQEFGQGRVEPVRSRPPRTPLVAITEPVKKLEPVLPAAPTEPVDTFPELGNVIYPVSKIPNWGAMRTAHEWSRTHAEMPTSSFVTVPEYNLEDLMFPLFEIQRDLQEFRIPILTAKLFYSTRFFGRYDLDSGEFEGTHPGIDMKLAPGAPISSIAGGRVHYAGTDEYLGNYVMILHRLPSGRSVVSVYGHLQSHNVRKGQEVAPGDVIGVAGSTGRSSDTHLHLQVDYYNPKEPGGIHEVYAPSSVPSSGEAAKHTLHPITFIANY